MPAARASRLLSWWPVEAHLQGCRDTPRARVTVFAQDGSSSTSRLDEEDATDFRRRRRPRPQNPPDISVSNSGGQK